MYGPQGADMFTLEQLRHVKRLAVSEGLMLHMHVAQGDREIDQMLVVTVLRTPAFLEQIGYLDEQLRWRCISPRRPEDETGHCL